LPFCEIAAQGSALIAELLPEPQKGNQIDGPKDNCPRFSNLLVSKLHNWKIEKVNDELMTVIDGDSVERMSF
jgi:hypothetical protein